MKKVAILGAGESGVGAALLAAKLGEEVWVSDAGKIQDRFRSVLETNQIPFEEGKHTYKTFFEADIIVKSPGIPDTVPLIRQLNEQGKSVISEIEYASRYTDAKIIALTGSNGKTTTTSLVGHLMQEVGENVAVGGNIGQSFAWQVATKNPDWYVLEISSFQLDNIESFRPDVAVLLNITPDHLDRYEGSIKQYGAAKFRITENQKEEDLFIYNVDDPETQEQLPSHEITAQKWGFSLNKKEGSRAWMDGSALQLEDWQADFEEMSLLGQHNQLNTLAALLAVQAVGVDLERLSGALKTFQPIPNRLEPVAEIDGVRFINDSKATNVDAVYYALESMNRPTIWLAGGVDKGNEYATIQGLVEEKVKAIVVLGKKIEKFHRDFQKPVYQALSMKAAISKAKEIAEKGDTVLLSPACASFDLFRNYEDRGDQFREIVKELKVKS